MRCSHVHHRKGQCLRSDAPHTLHTYLAPKARSRKGYAKSRRWALDRAQGRCEAVRVWPHDCVGDLEVHHLLRRSQGGTDDLDNLIVVCGVAHRQVHANPSWAYSVGLLRRNAA